MVDGLLQEHALTVAQLDGIAFGNGPGSFTGVRIACGVAQGLAMGAGLRLAPIATLMALAEATRRDRVLCCLDARMGEIYLAAYERYEEGWNTIIEPMLCKADAGPVLPGKGWFGAGSGFDVYGTALNERYSGPLGDVDGALIPHAREVARLAVQVFLRGQAVEPEDAAPLYVRNRVALTTAERGRGERL